MYVFICFSFFLFKWLKHILIQHLGPWPKPVNENTKFPVYFKIDSIVVSQKSSVLSLTPPPPQSTSETTSSSQNNTVSDAWFKVVVVIPIVVVLATMAAVVYYFCIKKKKNDEASNNDGEVKLEHVDGGRRDSMGSERKLENMMAGSSAIRVKVPDDGDVANAAEAAVVATESVSGSSIIP